MIPRSSPVTELSILDGETRFSDPGLDLDNGDVFVDPLTPPPLPGFNFDRRPGEFISEESEFEKNPPLSHGS